MRRFSIARCTRDLKAQALPPLQLGEHVALKAACATNILTLPALFPQNRFRGGKMGNAGLSQLGDDSPAVLAARREGFSIP